MSRKDQSVSYATIITNLALVKTNDLSLPNIKNAFEITVFYLFDSFFLFNFDLYDIDDWYMIFW